MSGILGYVGMLLGIGDDEPPAPTLFGDPYWADVVLLLHGDGDDGGTVFTDSSGSAHTPSSAISPVVTSQGNQKFGTAALNFTGGRIYFDDHADWDMGSGEFTCEAWIRLDAGSDFVVRYISGQNDSALNNSTFRLGLSALYKLFGSANNGSVTTITGTITIPVSQFIHVALVRHGDVLRLFLNGVQEASAAFTGTIPDSTYKLAIGAGGEYLGGSTSARMYGLMNDFRITKGVARYTTKTFIPPARALDSYDTPAELWTPVELSNVPKLWLDADSLISKNGSTVSLWQSRVGTGLHMENTYAPRQPVYIADALNGKPAVRFVSTPNVRNMTQGTTTGRGFVRNTSAAWMFAIVKKQDEDVTGTAAIVAHNSIGSSQNPRFSMLVSNAGQLNKIGMAVRRLDANATAYLYDPTARWGEYALVLLSMDYAAGRGRVYVNGEMTAENASLTSTGNTSDTNDTSYPTIGTGYIAGVEAPSLADMACYILGAGSLPSDDEIDKLFGWAAHYWGLESELPSGHTYKSAPPYL